MALTGNKGEWSEIYIFFKILTEQKIYTVDADYNRIKDVFLNVISIIREEYKNYIYKYNTGSTVVIKLRNYIQSQPIMNKNRKYIASFKVQNIAAFTLDEFVERVKTITNADTEISNIAAIVVTKTTLDP